MQIYSKNSKNCFFSLISWPIFILFVLSDMARWRLQNLYKKFRNSLIMLIYANLRSPGRDPGVQSAIIFFFFFFFPPPPFLFMSLPGHQIFIFWPVENCTTWNLWYLMLRDAGWALRHWRSGFSLLGWSYDMFLLSSNWMIVHWLGSGKWQSTHHSDCENDLGKLGLKKKYRNDLMWLISASELHEITSHIVIHVHVCKACVHELNICTNWINGTCIEKKTSLEYSCVTFDV